MSRDVLTYRAARRNFARNLRRAYARGERDHATIGDFLSRVKGHFWGPGAAERARYEKERRAKEREAKRRAKGRAK